MKKTSKTPEAPEAAEASDAQIFEYKDTAQRLIEMLKAGTAPWQRPWEPGERNGFMPYNPSTGKRYSGINAVFLMMAGFEDTRWLTFKQALAMDACVKKGAKGTKIQFWTHHKLITKKDEDGKPVKDKLGNLVKVKIWLPKPLVKSAWVFNADQIDGLPERVVTPAPEAGWAQIDRIEAIIQASGAKIIESGKGEAYYSPGPDHIHMPYESMFKEATYYYATKLHELAHWTGHRSRLNRLSMDEFGSPGYAREELRAEIASMIIGDELGLGHDPEDHASYVGDWIKVLESDPEEIYRAAADAEKISRFIFELEKKLENELGEQEPEEDTEFSPS